MEDFGLDSRLQPSRSFSTLSESTVNSSVVNRMIVAQNTTNNNHFAVENFVRESNAAPQNIKIEGSSGIRVGDAIYNIYYPPNNEERNGSRLRRNSSSSSDNIQEASTTSKKTKCANFRLSKLHIFIIILVVTLIATAASLSILMMPKNDSQDTTTTSLDTTISEFPTEETEPITDSTTTSSSSTLGTSAEPIENLIIPRKEWTLDPIHPDVVFLSDNSYPIRRIIVGQTDDTETCVNRSECISKVQAIRNRYPTLLDIPWNFLIGGDGHVYEGRGYRYEGQHTMNVDASDYNDIGIGIGFIGNFSTQQLSALITGAFEDFIDESLASENLVDDYRVFFQNQLTYKENEALELENYLKTMGKFYNLQRIYKREEWDAQPSVPGIERINNPLDRVIVHHSASYACSNYENCISSMKMLQDNAFKLFNLSEINYNFIIGGMDDYSIVMEGRGFNNRGAHTACCVGDVGNAVALGIGLIGHYSNYPPGPALMTALRTFIDDSAALGKLKDGFPVHLKRDYDNSVSPGDYVISIIENWPDYVKYVRP